ncbi:hypothetical protein MG5_01697 [Candida albicans P57072]|uniref:Uncharacterized protein n=1 Tax=Candida albicans P78048 TaxID=1094989 RepID=A0AB34PVI0_CANAX|nr:hypothetical protein MEO_01701 [Candida albicans P94015]KGR12064.1 hypothetical protein MG5_01697 [Candida albicans P57072]KGR14814.1 hypothetical protein MG3_01685 [Candida albicans P78048]KGU13995.1 hypothetical protein MEY_01709 [Candida albicans 19F]KHC37902.1 hypothetical protein MGO_01665 [Candida albicans P76055]KHC53393.1 hypothetical protein MEW_01650 [Candida albicans P60002]KHC59419.1 hypothetical protein MGC_01690 [Candida albicans P37039]RLP62984.1 hypothetical protein L150_0
MRSQSLPLPLIESPDSIDLDPINHENLAVYGYLLLISTWMLFIISINSIFEIWRFIIQPLQSSPTSLLLYDKLTISFETIDSYIIKLWCIYVVCWWWAIVSWSGLKLFRHSKGIQG